MTEFDVVLDPADAELVKRVVSEGHFESVSEVVAASLQLLRTEISENGYFFISDDSED
ncbi:hypothetical protein EK0264_15855 [Epidermidibacterium keratini]|uniref:Type II toxin-antitoxin system ParD family antitoxin n=1 Tax=Epidermidibacterium keratini TaxID=1891644 RepID=A0A7L4YRE3_9ACTN|nr:hypothetical protein [Epidermidibacterium keratini]QHC01618.1 hypothetical protein EK0264_15855 [Epidermidibacterium keratini]